jgi:hypothetical protein
MSLNRDTNILEGENSLRSPYKLATSGKYGLDKRIQTSINKHRISVGTFSCTISTYQIKNGNNKNGIN